jgi:hypothetical protein
MSDRPVHCPVCGKTVFDEEGDYDICTVCGWENDPVQTRDADYAGGANRISLNEARRKWAASHGTTDDNEN